MNKDTLLQVLPPDQDQWVKISDNQTVPDIIEAIVQAHYENETLYNKIALFFNAPTVEQIAENIASFEAETFQYREETVDTQRIKLPQGFLSRGYGDCKMFASFAGGVLSGIERLTGKKINWFYRFASYNLMRRDPYHVYVVVRDKGRDLIIDETPGADGKQPVWVIDEKIETGPMPLYKQIAGAEIDFSPGVEMPPVVIDTFVPDHYVGPISYLQNLGVLSPLGTFNEARYRFLNAVYSADQRALLNNAITALMAEEGTTVGSWFGDVFKGVQHFAAGMGMQVPRASFLILVRMNAFGYANKLAKALQFTDSREKLEDIWWRLGGQPDVLRNTIAEGATKPPATTVDGGGSAQAAKDLALSGGTYRDAAGILHDVNTGAVVTGNSVGAYGYTDPEGGAAIGIVPVVAAAIISSATIVITAMIPIITKLLDKHSTTQPGLPVDPVTGLPVNYSGNSGNAIQNFISQNPLVVAALAAVLGFYIYENS